MSSNVPSATDLSRFSGAHRAFAESLFEEIRALSASPAPGRGVTRFGYDEVETEVLKVLEARGRALGLTIEYDAAGHLHMRYPGRNPDLPAVWCGSHADSVWDGGNYDGLAGIVAALVTARAMREDGFVPDRDFVVLAIRCEEPGVTGSRAMMGQLTDADLGRRWTPESPTLAERLAALGLDPRRLKTGEPVVDLKKIAAFLELHIEQGVRPDQPKSPRVALVTGIRGMVYHRVIHCYGETAHAGAVDYPFRHDALQAAMRLAVTMQDRWAERVAKGDDLVFTTGILQTDPTAIYNGISGHVRFSLDLRSLSVETRERFYAEYRAEADRIAERAGVRFEFDPPGYLVPQVSDEGLLARLDRAAQRVGVPVLREPSGAGHDSQTFGGVGVPFVMLFVANQNGSHNPDEAMEIDDFLAGTAILYDSIRHFDAEPA